MSQVENSPVVPVPGAGSFLRGLPWLALIFVFAFLSWAVWEPFFSQFMEPAAAQFASIGMGPQGAYLVCIMAMAGNWPVAGIQNPWVRGIAMIVLAKVITAAFWLILICGFDFDIVKWGFPLIANSWLILSITSFVGGDAHLAHIPPVRRMFLNLLISVGFTVVLMQTIVIFPAQWFPFLQTLLITGSASYFFRRVKQPTYSFLVWPLLLGLMWFGLVVATYCGYYQVATEPTQFWVWTLGTSTPEFDLFFALACGFNFAVFACIQCWPFCRIPQPWAAVVAVLCMIVWCVALTPIVGSVFSSLAPENPLWQAQIMAWHMVFWGFSWVYCFGIGQTPYRWINQKTAGTWDDVN